LQELPQEEVNEPNAAPKGGLNFAVYIRTIKRKALLIAGIAGLAAGAAGFFARDEPPVYQGSFQLLVEPVSSTGRNSDPRTLLRTEGVGSVDESVFRLDYKTQITILTGPKIMDTIIERILAEHPNFEVDTLWEKFTVERLGEDEFDPTAGTKILQVSYQGSDREIVQTVLETAAEKYLKYSLEERKTRISEGVKFIDDQLPDLQKRATEIQNQQQKLQEQFDSLDPATTGQELFNQVRQLTTQQVTTQRELQEQRSLYDTLRQQLELNPEEAMAAAALSQNPNRTALLSQIKELDRQIAIDSGRFTPNSPNLRSLQKKRQNLRALLDRETQQILGDNLSQATGNSQVLAFKDPTQISLIQQLITVANQIQVLEVRAQAIAKAQVSYERQAERLPSATRKYKELQRQLELTTKTLNQFLSHRETLRIEAAQNDVPWELIAKPFVPPISEASSSTKKMMMVGVVGGLVLGVIVAFVIEKFRNIFYSAEDITDATKLPLLGEIPWIPSIAKPTSQFLPSFNTNLAVVEATPALERLDLPFADALDTLYANLRFLYPNPPLGSLVLSSAEPGDGKSTVALYLALTAVAGGQRVLLVDANLRSPQLHHQLNLSNHKGLSDLLVDSLDPDALIQPVGRAENLFVLTAGSKLDACKRLGSNQMEKMMAAWQSSYDLAIYDAPHFLEFADASFLAVNSDGLVLTVGVRKTRSSVVKQMMKQIDKFQLPSLGVVTTRVRPPLSLWPMSRSVESKPEQSLILETPESPHPELSSQSVLSREPFE